MKDSIKVTEIFLSLQGESRFVGYPTVFIRLTGCPLRCRYCDTAYAFYGGERMTISVVLGQVAEYGVRHVLLTGGEPLAQEGAYGLLTQLCDNGYSVSLETSGALDVSQVDARVVKVMDIKTPGSGEDKKNRISNLQYLQAEDELKFVLRDRNDYEWAKDFLKAHNCFKQPYARNILLSPVYDVLSPTDLADWIVADRLPVRFQIQLHKYLWGNEAGR